jgi:uncharacterized membrane protein
MPAAKSTGGIAPMVTAGLANGAKGLVTAMGKQILSSATERIGGTTERLTEYASNGGGPGLMKAVTGRGEKQGGGSKDKSLKVTNIFEQIDVAVPARLAYDQWTRFTEFPDFMKKVESVEQEEDEKLKWKAQVLWSHRTWESTILEQVPDRRIVWRSEGEKGSVDGAVSFHELAPELTRIMLVLEYHPQGFFERTGNIWRAQGRRARLELKHFARHLMTEAILHADEVEGWRGEIHDGEVVKDNDTARAEEQQHTQGDGGRRDGSRRSEEPPRGEGERRRGSDERRQTSDRRDTGRARRTGGPEGRPAGRPARRSEEAKRPARPGRE